MLYTQEIYLECYQIILNSSPADCLGRHNGNGCPSVCKLFLKVTFTIYRRNLHVRTCINHSEISKKHINYYAWETNHNQL